MVNIKFKTNLIFFSFFLYGINGFASDLQKCPSDTAVVWNNCFGTYSYDDGSQYTGGFKDDQMHGQGTYTAANGDVYVGEFNDGLYHGQGTITSPDGIVSKGTWINDILQPADGLFKIEGNKLYFDTENTIGVNGIDQNHTKNIFDILKSNDQIKTLVLNSEGGLIAAAQEIADLIIDAELDTHVDGICFSACATIFLGGNVRSLGLGGKIGFHKGSWDATNIKAYYKSNKEDEGWTDPFEFASWLYEDTQSDVFKEFEYLLERGVQPNFAIKTLKADADGMWKPRRSELRSGGILTQ